MGANTARATRGICLQSHGSAFMINNSGKWIGRRHKRHTQNSEVRRRQAEVRSTCFCLVAGVRREHNPSAKYRRRLCVIEVSIAGALALIWLATAMEQWLSFERRNQIARSIMVHEYNITSPVALWLALASHRCVSTRTECVGLISDA